LATLKTTVFKAKASFEDEQMMLTVLVTTADERRYYYSHAASVCDWVTPIYACNDNYSIVMIIMPFLMPNQECQSTKVTGKTNHMNSLQLTVN